MGMVRTESPRVQRDARSIAPLQPDPAEQACRLFRRLAYARSANHFTGVKETLAELHRLGWMVVPIAPRRGREGR